MEVCRKRKKQDGKRLNWYRNGGYQSVMFVPSTPHSMLKKEFDMEIKKSRFSIRVVEKAGRSLKDTLQKSNPFKERTCKRPRCPVCLTAGKGRCEQSSVTYEIVCQSCGGKYIGQTTRSLYERGGEHVRDLEQRRGALWRHCVERHGSEIEAFQYSVTGTYVGDCMLRKITEPVQIEREKPEMNTKEEWNFVNIPRARTF